MIARAAAIVSLAATASCASVLGDDFDLVDCSAGPPTGVCDEPSEANPGDACDRCFDCAVACACKDRWDDCLREGSPCDQVFDCYDTCEGTPEEQACEAACDDANPVGAADLNATIICIYEEECTQACAASGT